MDDIFEKIRKAKIAFAENVVMDDLKDKGLLKEPGIMACEPHIRRGDKRDRDEHHSMDELYEHRHALFGALAKLCGGWKSRKHADGTMFDGWFIGGIDLPTGNISYHMPIELFEDFPALELVSAPEWDGYTPDDVVKRLRAFWHRV